MSQYYDGTKLLSLSDINGERPEIYICVGNRTAGKSVYFKRLLVNNFKTSGKKFIYLYRFSYQLSGAAEQFFNDIKPLFFEFDEMTQEPISKGLFYRLRLNGEECGFAVALSNVDALKNCRSYFIDVENVLLDEFQSETNHYCSKETEKFQSLHYTIASGMGKQYRYIRTFLVGNFVSLLNIYFVALGIHKRLRNDTKFLRGDGFVLEQTFNESASQSILKSGFAQAFTNKSYSNYASHNIYLNDNTAFVEKMKGSFRYKATIKFENNYYGVREYSENGLVYISDSIDSTYPYILTFSADDHNTNCIMIDRYSVLIAQLRKAFDLGCMRFENLQCKNMMLDVLSYS